MIGTHSLVVGGVDLSCYVDTLDVTHGRDDSTSPPEASSVTATLDLADYVLPAAVEIGAAVTVKTTFPTWSEVRFTGTVTDITLGWDDAGEDSPNAGIGQLTCVGPLAPIGRAVVGDTPFPQELDGARVSRVLALAGITLDPLTSDPGTVQILPRDVDATDALSVATDAATSAMGLLWETKAGEVRYADANHRRNIPVAVTFDACDILITPSWSRTLEGLINKVSLGYGVAPEGQDQPRVYYSDADSIAKYGLYSYELTTSLAALADANAVAQYLVTLNRVPVWIMTDLPVSVADLTEAETRTLLGLDMHSLIGLTGLPQIASGAETTAYLWLEGWSEHLEFGVHDLTFTVSGFCRTAPPPRWNDLDPSYTWDTVGSLTWNDASCLGPPVNRGRWDDVPASTRWDTAPGTWDTWPT